MRSVLLVGSPNSGKTTLYNWLTGSNSEVVNYPGATVEYSCGELQKSLRLKYQNLNESSFQIIDTPGIYSLTPTSSDEKVTIDLIFNQSKSVSDLLLIVMDCTQLNRQILLAENIISSNRPVIVVLTMTDLIKKEDKEINIEAFKDFLKVNDVILFEGVFGQGLDEIIKAIDLKISIQELQSNFQDRVYNSEEKLMALSKIQNFINNKAFRKKNQSNPNQDKENKKINNQVINQTLKIDQYLLHPFWGYLIFIAVMTLFFTSIYTLSAPMMDFIDEIFSLAIFEIKNIIPGLFGEFLADGILQAFAGVVVFVPQIFILFLGIGLFESTGYLARLAILIDGPLKKIGLGGRSFVPLLSGFACAIPAIMATRNIISKKERLIAQLTIPFMSCSARLPVFGLMIGFLFQNHSALFAGFILTGLYFLSLVFGSLASGLLNKLIKTKEESLLAMDLPFYRWPKISILFRQSFSKSKSFVQKAGPVIISLAVILWLANTYPRDQDKKYAMQIAEFIEPVFEPMGLDGRAGFAILSSFAAREVFVSSLALSLKSVDSAGQAIDVESDVTPLLQVMDKAQLKNGQPLFTVASCIGILLFFLIATQCLSTVAILKKETGGWFWALIQLFASNIVAYIIAVSVVRSLIYFA